MNQEQKLPTPYYIVYEDRLRRNLELIRQVEQRGGVKIIMAFKANALWKTFPIIRAYVTSSTASSLNELKLSHEFLGEDVHSYCPVYPDELFNEFLKGSSHITFNTKAQFEKFYPRLKAYNEINTDRRVSPGLRVNPRCSVIETDIYNPCLPGSRFGVYAEELAEGLPEGVEGLHFHALCESDSHDLEKVLEAFESQFGHLLDRVRWLNMGGGHLMTRKGYDTEHLVSVLNRIHEKYPHLKLIMEPGSAFTWQTGDLVTKVLDIHEDAGIKTAIIDASFACHMPDCLEMPYQPVIEEAVGEYGGKPMPADGKTFSYRLGGNSCLSGDFVGDWEFDRELKPGDILTLKDMNHYTTVKTTMFNGIQHPSIWLQPAKGLPRLLREFTYNDYRSRMS